MTEELIKRQLALEDESLSIGMARYRQAVAEREVVFTRPGATLLQRSINAMVQQIEEFMRPSKGGRHYLVQRLIADLDPLDLAYLTARKILSDLARQRRTVNRVACSLGALVCLQKQYLYMRAHQRARAKVIDSIVTMHPKYRERRWREFVKQSEDIPETWSTEEKLRVGIKLIDMFIEATGLIERVQEPGVGKKASQWVLRLTDEAADWITRYNEQCEAMTPIFLPMVVPPLPWQGVYGGGYLTQAGPFRFPVVKSRVKVYLDRLEHHDMPLVYRAINALQNTAWRINKRVYEVIQEVWKLDLPYGGLPQTETIPLPPKQWSSEEEFQRLKAENPEVIKAWKAAARDVYSLRFRNRTRKLQMSQKLWTAQKFLNEERIYWVWTTDFRGRLYPVSSALHPQGDDMSRGLLEFADGKPLGERGAYWLMVHLANKYGHDKVPFDERVQWVQDHHDEILACAEDPMCNLFWDGADSPWQFLAACFEYKGYIEQGESFESHLPIAMDGTCNGLQNFSAMLRDEVGGRAVNLVPDEYPQDVYQRVADRVNSLIEEDAEKGIEPAKFWLGKIDRSLAKRNVMTVPYGVTRWGMREQLEDEILDRPDIEFENPMQRKEALRYLTLKMKQGIDQVIVGAKVAMDWLQAVAKCASKAHHHIEWTTPSGFLVMQLYRKFRTKSLITFWGKARVRVKTSYVEETPELDKRRQSNGIAPNFVHSCDAAHLVLTINRLVDQGIDSFSAVHDSYAVHACNVDIMNRTLREAFVEMYSEHILQDFANQVQAQLPEAVAKEVPPVPEFGNLDLKGVLQSPYFFG